MTIDEWYDLGIELGLSTYIMDNIQESLANDEDSARLKLFRKWLEENEDPTWANIRKALINIGHRYLAKEILKKQSGKYFNLSIL